MAEVNVAVLIVLIAHTFSTLMLTGVIWFVQVVHYPLFGSVGEQGFAKYQENHMRRTSFLVVPLMLIEACSAAALPFLVSNQPLAWLGIGLLAIIWFSTFFLQVPKHRRLSEGFDRGAHRDLISSNWLRTIAWSGRSALALALLLQSI